VVLPAEDPVVMIRKNIFKVIIVGEGGVGKTCLVRRYVDDFFAQDMKMTIGVDLSVKRIDNGSGDKILQIWDLGGQPHFKDVADIYFRGASGMLAVFDVTRKASLDRLIDWIERVQAMLGRIPMVVIGNKVDLRNPTEGIVGVSKEEGAQFASKFESPYVETSAKDNAGVEDAFLALARKLVPKTESN
jgi:Ras-related protein Rab-1A